jgi:hypothetical protein
MMLFGCTLDIDSRVDAMSYSMRRTKIIVVNVANVVAL